MRIAENPAYVLHSLPKGFPKLLPTAVFLVMFAALGLSGVLLLPHTTELPTPQPVTLSVTSKVPVTVITYNVRRAKGTKYSVSLEVEALPISPLEPLGSKVALTVGLPTGAMFVDCSPLVCIDLDGLKLWRQSLILDASGHATTRMVVSAPTFAYTTNSTDASASIPSIQYTGPGRPELDTRYAISSADGYDWASYPTTFADDRLAAWLEPLVNDAGVSRAAVGINHDKEESNSVSTFFAGALIALAGAALIAAVQEALHFRR